MNKQQIFLIVTALVLIAGLFFLGPVTPLKKEGTAAAAAPAQPAQQARPLDIDAYIIQQVARLPVFGQQYITSIRNEVKRGDVKAQQIKAFQQEARYWRDTVDNPIAYFHFTEKAASLENSEKSLTFAAHSILRYLPFAEQPTERVWLANQGRSLFEKAITINPANDSSSVGLGGCYIYGASKGEGDSPMTGILAIRQVAAKDSNNIFAQYMLGVGGVVSGQLDKAAARFEKVAKAEPDNLEVLFKLAETYENLGDKPNAIRWYTVILSKSNIPGMKKELEARISQLKQ